MSLEMYIASKSTGTGLLRLFRNTSDLAMHHLAIDIGRNDATLLHSLSVALPEGIMQMMNPVTILKYTLYFSSFGLKIFHACYPYICVHTLSNKQGLTQNIS